MCPKRNQGRYQNFLFFPYPILSMDSFLIWLRQLWLTFHPDPQLKRMTQIWKRFSSQTSIETFHIKITSPVEPSQFDQNLSKAHFLIDLWRCSMTLFAPKNSHQPDDWSLQQSWFIKHGIWKLKGRHKFRESVECDSHNVV